MSVALDLRVSEPSAPAIRQRVLHIGRRPIEVRGPSIRDARLHLSALILTVMTLGITWMGFRVSFAVLLVSVGLCAAVEAALVLVRHGALVWPASAMQTATSTVLLLRVTDWVPRGAWDLHHWPQFVGVSLAGVAGKHLLRVGGRHIFNPSNVALVVAFAVLGSRRVEPLALWWGPLRPPLLMAYAVILVGGAAITRRLRLLAMAATCWSVMATGFAVLGATGHAIVADWSFSPVSGMRYWTILASSPEVLLFCLFMVTDPRTVPTGSRDRVRFAATVGTTSVVLASLARSEFGTKLGILAGLAVVSAVTALVTRSTLSQHLTITTGRRRAVVAAVAALAVIALSATPRHTIRPLSVAPVATALRPSSVPDPTIDADVAGISGKLGSLEGARRLGEQLAEALAIEAEAFGQGDPSILAAVDHGDRLVAQEAALRSMIASGVRVVTTYRFDTLHLSVVFPGGAQSGANAGVAVTGVMVVTEVDTTGHVLTSTEQSLRTTFSMREVGPGRWMITDELPYRGATP